MSHYFIWKYRRCNKALAWTAAATHNIGQLPAICGHSLPRESLSFVHLPWVSYGEH